MASTCCPSRPLFPSPHLPPFKHPKSPPFFLNNSTSISSSSSSSSISCTTSKNTTAGVVKNKRNRYRKAYPGEAKGIVQEMRFVAMKLRNNNDAKNSSGGDGGEESAARADKNKTWWPSMEGFVKYLVDSKLVFETLEKIIDDSTDVACGWGRQTDPQRFFCYLHISISRV